MRAPFFLLLPFFLFCHALAQFISTLLERAHEKKANDEAIGPLMRNILDIEAPEILFSEMFALLVAGHDTTAYTMQFLLFELARHPSHQERVREEAREIFSRLEQRGERLHYSHLHQFDFLSRCIAETLRLWNVAMTTFGRVTTHKDTVSSELRRGSHVVIPEGTAFTFWYFGHHHSSALWGDDALTFNPTRTFDPHELQHGHVEQGEPAMISRTPCTYRFHPFSVPSRDCMGKNFAAMEMKIVVSKLVLAFYFEVGGDTLKEADVFPSLSNSTFCHWARHSGATVQPEALWMKVTPVRRSKESASKL
jgi:cytochrome P450